MVFVRYREQTAASLILIIVENIALRLIIISDKWKSYISIRNCNNQYNHLTVNHSEIFVDPESGAHPNTFGKNVGCSKVCLQMTFWFHPSDDQSQLIDRYLCEFMLRKWLPEHANPFQIISEVISAFWPLQ